MAALIGNPIIYENHYRPHNDKYLFATAFNLKAD